VQKDRKSKSGGAWADRCHRPISSNSGTVIEFGQNYRLDTLVETGSFLGDMVHGCRKRFERIISIELDLDIMRITPPRKSENELSG
jgi:hypothetical protein